MNGLRRHARRLVKHGAWMSLSIGGLAVFRGVLPDALLKSAAEVSGNFLQTFGGMYGVIVAFAIYVVWQQHNETQVAVEREAVALSELFTMLGWFTSWAERDDVRRHLRTYARLVPMLNGRAPEREEDDEKRLFDRSLRAFLAHPPAEGEQRFFDTALELFHELNEAREHRLTVSRLHLPEGLKWFVFLGGAISIGAVWLLYLDSFALQAALTAGMTWVVVASASLILDLDDPYGGDFVVHWNRFNLAGERMDAAICPPQVAL